MSYIIISVQNTHCDMNNPEKEKCALVTGFALVAHLQQGKTAQMLIIPSGQQQCLGPCF